MIITEDLGLIFEKAICILYEIDYKGTFKYSIDDAIKLKDRIYKLKELLPVNLRHIAINKNKYDFSYIDENGNNNYLSAKTSKNNGKICPQVIGQISKNKFCELFNLNKSIDLNGIKVFIENSITLLLDAYIKNTFDCPIIYYNKHKDKCLLIEIINEIIWTNYQITFSHKNKNKEWNESSIGEFQIHRNRDCIKFRWSIQNLLNYFQSNFIIKEI